MQDFLILTLKQNKEYISSRKQSRIQCYGAENVDPTAPKDMKESFNYNNTTYARESYGP